MTKRTLGVRPPSKGRADFARLRRMSDAEIERTAPPELPLFSADFWEQATIQVPTRKTAISLRVDEDVLDWFKSGGPRYQTRMNAILRSYVSHMRRRKEKGRPNKPVQRPAAGARRAVTKRSRPPTQAKLRSSRKGRSR
jgi:uncharacterized protein (DUF4415 family)